MKYYFELIKYWLKLIKWRPHKVNSNAWTVPVSGTYQITYQMVGKIYRYDH